MSLIIDQKLQGFNSASLREIGRGSFGQVFLLAPDKVLKQCYNQQKDQLGWDGETALIPLPAHTNLVKILAISYQFESGETHLVNTESPVPLTSRSPQIIQVQQVIMEKGSSSFNIKDSSPLEACHIFQQIIQGLMHLHNHGLAHRDIKPENILINEETQEVKICDFGLVCKYDNREKFQEVVGARDFQAPEILIEPEANEVDVRPRDIWAAVMFFLNILTKKPSPFTGNPVQVMKKLFDYTKDPNEVHTNIEKWVAEKILCEDQRILILNIIKQGLNSNFQKRLNAEKILRCLPFKNPEPEPEPEPALRLGTPFLPVQVTSNRLVLPPCHA